ncbi:MAG: RNA polymerase sigma factor [Isosphaeraceae bacterium]
MERSAAQFPRGSLDTLWTVGALGAMTDGELLDHFQVHRDTSGQDAFRILVQRHGPMVLGLCRSLLRDTHDAEDAFQATFLVLVRRADSIRNRATLGPWLCGVTYRVARRARVRSIRRRRHEVAVVDEPAGPSGADRDRTSTEAAIQEEIARLPESLRAPLVLCCLEGASLLLAQNKRPSGPQPRQQPNPGDLQRKTQQIMQALEEPIVMPFPKKTPLNDVLKYIKVATTTPAFSGIPIYVEPLGLQEANKSINSTIELDRSDLPLKTSLRLILKPLGLSYIVKDGFLMIDSRSAITETRVEDVERKLDRVLEALERLERAR